VPGPAARGEKTPSDGESATPKSGEPGEVAAGEAAPATPLPPVARPPETRPAKPAARAPTSPTPSTAKSGERFFGFRLSGSDPWLTVGVVGAAAIFFLLVVALLLRKHSRRTSLDALESSREPIDSGDAFTTLGAGTDLGTPRETYPAAGPGLFDDESEKGDMDMAAQIPIERTRMTPPPGADVESAPPVRDLERRMTQLESRLDQVNEARERLERQVAAQSEELRVQRAAIARTQRALRGMTRSGDEATEPALRDPAKPPPGRV
jgi:hypothetical protein